MTPRSWERDVIAACLLLAMTGAAPAADPVWINPVGGTFTVPGNWMDGIVPGPFDNAVFQLDQPEAYTITFAQSQTLGALLFGRDRVRLELQGFQLTLTGDPSVLMGQVAHEPGYLTVAGGTIESKGVQLGAVNFGPGDVTVCGPGDTFGGDDLMWTIDGDLCVGAVGQGDIFIEDAASVHVLGDCVHGLGRVFVDGATAALTVDGDWAMDHNLNTTAMLTCGSTAIVHGMLHVATSEYSDPMFFVEDVGTSLTVHGQTRLGYSFRAGHMRIRGGATVTSLGGVTLETMPGSALCQVWVGAGPSQGEPTSTWDIEGALDVGTNGPAAYLLVHSSGVVNVSGDVLVDGAIRSYNEFNVTGDIVVGINDPGLVFPCTGGTISATQMIINPGSEIIADAGTIGCPVTCAGTISFGTGSAPDLLYLDSLVLEDTAVCEHYLGEDEPGDTDTTFVNGTAELAGEIFVFAFEPPVPGAVYDLLTAETIIGTYDVETVPAGFVIRYVPGKVQAVVPLPADVNADGIVDVNDLIQVIVAWGPCPPPCPEDTNEDGEVDVDDLVEVILAWNLPAI